MSSCAQPTIGLGGYCPVARNTEHVSEQKWVKGSTEIQAIFDGRLYSFANEENKTAFLASPEKYVPAMGGLCVVCVRDANNYAEGSIAHVLRYRGRLFLFPDEKKKAIFNSNKTVYDEFDRAYKGLCLVSKLEGKHAK